MEYKLNQEQAQRVVNLLAQFPYKDVYDIIESIKEQGQKEE